MYQNDIPLILIAEPYTQAATIKSQTSGLPMPLSGTIEVELWVEGATSPSLTCSIANTRISSIDTTTGTIAFNIPASSVAGTGLFSPGYGSMVVNRTSAPAAQVAKWNVRYTTPGESPPTDADGSFTVNLKEYSVVVVGDTTTVGLPGPPGPPGADGSNGLMSAAEVSNGLRALIRLPETAGRKAVVVDFVNDGYVHIDRATGHELRSIANVSGLVRTNSTGGSVITDKRVIASVAANLSRATHAASGVPLGALFEPALAYMNGITQPTVAQLNASAGITNAASPPSGWSGSWLDFGDNSALRYAYSPFVTTVVGQPYCVSRAVRMADGSAPVPSLTNNAGDLSLVNENAIAGWLKPSDGTSGFDVIGPLADGVYLVQGYFIATSTGNNRSGAVIKYTGQSSKAFSTGPLIFHAGRYPASHFANASTTPASRAADRFDVPLSGFSTDGITLFGSFTAPPANTAWRFLLSLDTGANRLEGYFSNSGSLSLTFAAITGSTSRGATTNPLVAGSTYLFFMAVDPASGQICSKFTGVAAQQASLNAAYTSWAPTSLMIGHQSGVYQIGSPIAFMGVLDRALTPAEGAAFTG